MPERFAGGGGTTHIVLSLEALAIAEPSRDHTSAYTDPLCSPATLYTPSSPAPRPPPPPTSPTTRATRTLPPVVPTARVAPAPPFIPP